MVNKCWQMVLIEAPIWGHRLVGYQSNSLICICVLVVYNKNKFVSKTSSLIRSNVKKFKSFPVFKRCLIIKQSK